MADRVADHLVDLRLAVAQGLQGERRQPVDDLEIAAAGELFELDQREIRLDPGGIAVHDQADRAGRRDHRRLGVAVARGLALLQRPVPCRAGGVQHRRIGAGFAGEGDGADGEILIPRRLAIGGTAMVAHHTEHGVRVVGMAGEGAQFGRHVGRGLVGRAGHQRADRAAEGPAGVAVVGQARGHQIAADIGEAEAQRAVAVGQFGDPARRELRHQDRDFERERPQPHGMLEAGDIEGAVGPAERQQVERRQVARRVVEEHVFRARVRRVDPPAGRAGVPFVDRRIELDARIGRLPGGFGDPVPQLAGVHRVGFFAGGPLEQGPFAVRQGRCRGTRW